MVKKESGYTKFDNRLLEELARSNLSGSELKIMLFLIRKLDGFHQVEDRIPGVQIAEGTGIAKQHVSSTLKGLKIKNYIYRVNGKVGIKRAFGIWGKVTELVTLDKLPNPLPKVTYRADKKVTESGPSKETQKKTPKKGAILKVKMTRKEVDKLEGKDWLRADMTYKQRFNKSFIDRFLKMGEFRPLYNAYYELGEALNVKDPCAWLVARMERGPREED